jgi:hypothetical protein
MSQHTPGPWFDDGYRIRGPVHKRRMLIVEYKDNVYFNKADAPLIAAAPDMLNALKFAQNCIPRTLGCSYARALVSEAIKKAEGQS